MEICGIVLRDHGPSAIPARELYHWTKYCTGGPRGGNYRYGAAKPPDPAYGWFAAAVSPEYILFATTETHPTPEKAVAWLRASG